MSLMLLYGDRTKVNEFVMVVTVGPMPSMAVPIPRVVIVPVPVLIIPVMIPTVFIGFYGK
jgi:hypothetical protein